MYGISQNPDTKDYIMILQNIYCEKCGEEEYTDLKFKWCTQCQLNYLKSNFTNWTSGNEKIDDFIQKIQLKAKSFYYIIEWIPYNHFVDVKEIGKDYNNFIIYSAIWNEGLLYYNNDQEKLMRKSEQVTLIKLNYFNEVDKFLNKV
jgi:hypothetical protein